MNAPKRAIEMVIAISADDWREAITAARRAADHVEEHGPLCNLLSAGYAHSIEILIEQRPDVTHDSYHEELKVFLAALKKAESESAQ